MHNRFQYKNYMNKTAIIEYVRTIFIALLAALVIAGAATGCSKIIAEHHIKMLSKMTNTTQDNEVILSLITKYKELSAKNPGDYLINVRLGNLYELMFIYSSAEEQYKAAIAKSPYGVYSSYIGLANLYLKMGRYDEALKIMKQLRNTDHKPLLIAKGDFYMTIGDILWQKEDFEDAVKQYKFAFFFYKKVDSNKKDLAIAGILDCYNKLADIDFEKGNVSKAIDNLETALLYKETPIVYYKLAVLYKDYDALKANQYMEKTYKIDPGLINFDIYEEILINLIKYYYANGKDIETDLYKHKLRAVKNFQKRYVITENDVKINIKKLRLRNNLLHSKQTIICKFDIENTSKNDFNTLYLIVKVRYDGNSKEIYSKKLYSKENPLKSRKVSEEYNFKYTYTDKDEIFAAKEIKLDFYAGKKENMRKIPVYTVDIKRF